jgi:hypothetical protein
MRSGGGDFDQREFAIVGIFLNALAVCPDLSVVLLTRVLPSVAVLSVQG